MDEFVAPDFSKFTAAEIPDLSDHDTESDFWLRNHILNSGLRARFKEPVRSFAYNFIRRAEGAFLEHSEARSATYRFLEADRQPAVARYFEALLHWEFVLGQSCVHGAIPLLEKEASLAGLMLRSLRHLPVLHRVPQTVEPLAFVVLRVMLDVPASPGEVRHGFG